MEIWSGTRRVTDFPALLYVPPERQSRGRLTRQSPWPPTQ